MKRGKKSIWKSVGGGVRGNSFELDSKNFSILMITTCNSTSFSHDALALMIPFLKVFFLIVGPTQVKLYLPIQRSVTMWWVRECENHEIYCKRVISLRLYYSFTVGSITERFVCINIAQQWTFFCGAFFTN